MSVSVISCVSTHTASELKIGNLQFPEVQIGSVELYVVLTEPSAALSRLPYIKLTSLSARNGLSISFPSKIRSRWIEIERLTVTTQHSANSSCSTTRNILCNLSKGSLRDG